MKRSRWVILAVIITSLLAFFGFQCQKTETSSVIDEIRLCGHVYSASQRPLANEQAFIKLTLRGQRYALKGKSAVAVETVDQISVGELVKLDKNGMFCTGRMTLDSYYKPTKTKIVSLTARVGDKAVEGFLVKGQLGHPEPTSLYSQAFFNFEKPCKDTASRLMSEELKELFGGDRAVASRPAKSSAKAKP